MPGSVERSDPMPEDQVTEDHRQISYQQWGEQFFATAVSEDRLLGAVNDLAGQPIDFGPMGVGPGRIAKIRAYGEIGTAQAERLPVAAGEPISYRVLLPVSLSFELNLQVETHRFHAELGVPLTLSALAQEGLRIFVDVVPPRAADVSVTLRAEGLRASIMQRVANIEGELRRFVATYVTKELGKPRVQAARTIDVAALIDRAYASIAPAKPEAGVIADLNEALAADIRENEDAFLADGPDA